MDKILYFPYISIPNTPWLNRALLYWDEIGSIIPHEYIYNPENLGLYMRQLVKAQLVKQVFPGDYINKISNFKTNFTNLLINNKRVQLLLQNKREKEYISIHLEKMGGIEDDLINLGLAVEWKYPWYNVEKHTAFLFMTYLATSIGAISDYIPATDKKINLQNLGVNTRISLNHQKKRENLRVRVLDEILPAPVQVDNVDELYNFKLKYSEELIRFRNYIENFLLDLLLVPDEQVDERIIRFKIEAKDEINYICDKMKGNKWRTLNFSTLCSVASAGISIKSGNYETGSLGLVSAAASIFKPKDLDEVKRRPLAYAMYSQKAFSSSIRRHIAFDIENGNTNS